jgi:hypothetical protein
MKANNSKKFSILTLSLLSAFSMSAVANETEKKFHDADPRNSSFRGGIASDHNGEVKLITGGGFSNIFGGETNTQTNLVLEYFTQTNNARFRLAHFDERFGGLYTDINHIKDALDMYSVGYMLALNAVDGKASFFPSVNYTYANYQTDDINELIHKAVNDQDAGAAHLQSMGYSTGSGNGVSAQNIPQYVDLDDSHLGSVSLYGLVPWNETHYTVFQLAAGGSYSGEDMQYGNAMLLQGIRTKLGENILNIYFEAKYDHIAMENIDVLGAGTIDRVSNGESTFSVGFDFRF